MSDLLDKLIKTTSEVDIKRSAIDSVKSIGFPTTKVERWKYTSLRSLEKKALEQEQELEQVGAVVYPNFEHSTHLRFDNGMLSKVKDSIDSILEINPLDLSLLPVNQYHDEKDVFACLNVAQSDIGWHVKVKSDQSIMLSTTTSDNYAGSSHPCVFFEVEPGVTLNLYDLNYDYGDGLINWLQNIQLGETAVVNHYIHKSNQSSAVIQRCDVTVNKNAIYNCYALDTGGKLNKQDINVRLVDNDASCEIHGVGVMGEKDHSDWRTQISHVHPNTNSSESFKILADSTGTGCFNGKIHIYPGADNSHSSLETGNLLTSNEARVNIKPELEIYAEEVTASHGATVGQLDESSLFYMRARGIPIEEATSLLKYAFLAEPLENINDDNVKEAMLLALKNKCDSLQENYE